MPILENKSFVKRHARRLRLSSLASARRVVTRVKKVSQRRGLEGQRAMAGGLERMFVIAWDCSVTSRLGTHLIIALQTFGRHISVKKRALGSMALLYLVKLIDLK